MIYSLANFLASQDAFQAESYSATSVILYVGVIRQADGRVRVSGYRYMPTIHIDGDTRPAPIPAAGYDDVLAHVRGEMREPGGLRQIAPEPPAQGALVDICPIYKLPAAPDQPIGGDFAQYLATLGGATPHAPPWWFGPLLALTLLGLLGTVAWGMRIRADLRAQLERPARARRAMRRRAPLDDNVFLRELLECE